MPRRDLKVAIVGAGMMGEMHARAAQHCGATVVAIADRDTARARALSEEIKTQRQVFDPVEVLSLQDVNAIHICTPPHEHFEMCERALLANRSVLCEKPIAPTAADARKLTALAAERGVIVCPVHQFPFQHGVHRAVDSLKVIGPVVHLSAEMCTAGADKRDDEGMQLLALDIVTHALSLFRTFGVSALETVDWSVVSPRHGEMLLSGASGEVGLSALISTRGRPTSNVFRVIGANGTATIDLYHGFAVVEEGKVSRARKAARPFTSSAATFGAAAANGLMRAFAAETAFPGLRDLVGVFYDAVEKKRSAPISSGEMIDIAAARDRIVNLSRDRSPAQS